MIKRTLLTFAITLVACANDHPTNEEAGRQFSTALCQRLQQCFPSQFETAYPNGIQACVQRGLESIPAANRGDDSACTDSEVQTCVSDVHSMTCPNMQDNNLPTMIPKSCEKC